MNDRTDASDDEGRSGGRKAPGAPPPFYPPYPPFSFYPPPPYPPYPPYAPFTPPEAAAFPPGLLPFIEAQRSLLIWYRDQLERCAENDGFDDGLRQALSALMSSWLEATQSLREQRQHVLRLQTELVTRYLDVLDQLLNRTRGGP